MDDHYIAITVAISSAVVSAVSAVFAGMVAFRRAGSEARIAELKAIHEIQGMAVIENSAASKQHAEQIAILQKQQNECEQLHEEINKLKKAVHTHDG